jgi:hypothetical protein
MMRSTEAVGRMLVRHVLKPEMFLESSPPAKLS